MIVVMLFRLGMTIDEAINAYAKLSTAVFSDKNKWSDKAGISHAIANAIHSLDRKASLLEDELAELIQSNLNIEKRRAMEIRMLDDQGSRW